MAISTGNMRVRVWEVPIGEETGHFDDRELVEFLADKELLAYREHFFIHDNQPRLVMVFSYRDRYGVAAVPGPEKTKGKGQSNKPKQGKENTQTATHSPAAVAAEVPKDARGRKDWRSWLPEEERGIYDALRQWRWMRHQQDGIPLYIIINNRTMADVVRTKPDNITALRKIKRIGKATVERYGQEILDCLKQATLSVPAFEEGKQSPEPDESPDTEQAEEPKLGK